jgi:Meiotically Up-regulated Gene 113 (MUG113) protein
MQKEEILAEIKRTAKENGGKPIGKVRFERITGIKEYEWSRYWARYSDAQREAGFEPNSLVTAYGDEYLIGKLIAIIRELKKFPTKNELQMMKHKDPSLPARTTFEGLGSKQQVIAKVVAYCTNKPEYADIIELIGDVEIADDVSAPTDETKYGFVYLVRGHPGEYKIGRTNLVDRRLSELGATASIEQELVHEIKTDDPAGIESYWHRRFQDKRMKGEWFRLSPADVKTFKRWRRIY